MMNRITISGQFLPLRGIEVPIEGADAAGRGLEAARAGWGPDGRTTVVGPDGWDGGTDEVRGITEAGAGVWIDCGCIGGGMLGGWWRTLPDAVAGWAPLACDANPLPGGIFCVGATRPGPGLVVNAPGATEPVTFAPQCPQKRESGSLSVPQVVQRIPSNNITPDDRPNPVCYPRSWA